VAAPAAVPVGIRIDAVGVAAGVISVGTTEDQQLELPQDAVTVAWFEGGPVPGASGSALLAAHVDFHGQKGVFFDLARLDPGTRIEVDMSDGSTRPFATTGPAVQYPKYALPIDQVFRRGGEPQITLVTCGGKFDRAKHSYEDNTVVVATPVP
jgi:sortase (surface protein transpeptidase)